MCLNCFQMKKKGSNCWTSINTDGYISLTAHYIDSSWTLRKIILNFSLLPPPHNGVSIAEKILLLWKDWGIDKKVMCLTVDNASSNDVCVDMLKSQLRLCVMVIISCLLLCPCSEFDC